MKNLDQSPSPSTTLSTPKTPFTEEAYELAGVSSSRGSLDLGQLTHLTGVQASSLSIESTLKRFAIRSLSAGLSEEEAAARKRDLGANELEDDEKESLLSRFLEQFKEPMILLLFGSATISALMQQFSDAISITLAIIIVTTVAFVQEYRSDKALESLKQLVTHACTVVRDGVKKNMSASELVPGDVIEFQIGDRVPADVRLIKIAGELSVDESIFTGEGKPAVKHTDKIDHSAEDNEVSASPASPEQAASADKKGAAELDEDDNEKKLAELRKNAHVGECKNMVFMGTLVSTGKAKGIVTATGKHTELGSISSLLKEIEEKNTPLQDSMDNLSKQISIVSLAIIGVLFLVGGLTGKPWLEMFTIGISLAVAAIPEGLPIVVTVTLAMGVMRMAKRKAIVRKLPSVESLGATTVICVDKTGTLTQNEMTVTKIFVPSHPQSYIRVTGVGYSAAGEFHQVSMPADGQPTLANADGKRIQLGDVDTDPIKQLLVCGNLCNDAHFTHGQLVGQPTEGALLAAAKKAGMSDLRADGSRYQRIDEIPFTSETKWMAVRCKDSQTGASLYFVKGATERVLDRCSYMFAPGSTLAAPMDASLRRTVEQAAANFENSALRVMALAQGAELNHLTFLGLVGIYDPPREGVKDAIAKLHQSGVKVIMITGDSKKTAIAIAKELGIISANTEKSEDQIALSTDDVEDAVELEGKVEDACVFYRMAPVHKMKIVQALQNRRHIVAMTGDGVNDAPALKLANIGVAMGKSGTDVAKEAAVMVLVDDNFSTIMEAIEEGKAIFNNIKNFLRYQLATSVSCMLMIIYCTVFGLPLPLNPMQILFINIIMDGAPAQSLGVEPADDEVIRQPPRDPKKPIVNLAMITTIIRTALVMVVGSLYVFLREFNRDGSVTARDTTMTFATFVMYQMFNALNCRNAKKSVFSIGLLTNQAFNWSIGGSILGLIALVHIPFLNMIFETEPIYLRDWFLVVAVSASVFIVEEIVKVFWRGKNGSISTALPKPVTEERRSV